MQPQRMAAPYQPVLVRDVVGQLQLVERHHLLHPLLARGRAVRVDVHPLGHLRVRLAGHDPTAAKEHELLKNCLVGISLLLLLLLPWGLFSCCCSVGGWRQQDFFSSPLPPSVVPAYVAQGGKTVKEMVAGSLFAWATMLTPGRARGADRRNFVPSINLSCISSTKQPLFSILDAVHGPQSQLRPPPSSL